MESLLLTTTGTMSFIDLTDIGIKLNHPTNSLEIYSSNSDDILDLPTLSRSYQLQQAIDDGHVIVLTDTGLVVSNIKKAIFDLLRLLDIDTFLVSSRKCIRTHSAGGTIKTLDITNCNFTTPPKVTTSIKRNTASISLFGMVMIRTLTATSIDYIVATSNGIVLGGQGLQLDTSANYEVTFFLEGY